MFGKQNMITSAAKPSNGSFNILKVIVMIGLPFVHIIEAYAGLGVLTGNFDFFAKIISSLTVIGPSVFMICMGVGLANSSSPKRIRKTGIQMLIIALSFNIIRFFLPYILLWIEGVANWHSPITIIYASDIYSFVGLFYILYSFLKQFKLSIVKMFLISVLMMIFNAVLSYYIYSEKTLLTSFLGNFITISFDSYFPLFGWSIFPCLGMLIEEKILKADVKRRNIAFGILLLIGAGIFAAAVAVVYSSGGNIIDILVDFAIYSKLGFKQIGLIIGMALVLISVAYFLYQLMKENRFEKFLISFSSLILPYYILQWLGAMLVTLYPISIIWMFGGDFSISIAGYFIVSSIITVICIILTYKRGFTFSRWLFKASDYTKWRKHKKGA